MRYLLLIYGDETAADAYPSPEDMEEYMRPWFEYGARWESIIRGGDALMPTSTATSIRVRDGERLVTDGPFAETREQLGGYYVLECDTLDEALEAAAECPGALYGTVEVRPIMDIPEMPS